MASSKDSKSSSEEPKMRMASSEDSKSSSREPKKSKMRTSSDVIARLLWDESLHKEDFIVGYLDRFTGIVEEQFTSLDWRDPAVVDNFSLAIPKHRIQYFKYKNKKVWDKNLKLDIIYGSTGDVRKILEYIKEVDEIEKNFFDEDMLHDDDSDDKLAAGEVNDENAAETTGNENVEDGEVYDNADRSNFFVAVRITDPDTLENLNELRSLIILKDESLEECCMSISEYHLTLVTMRLNSAQDIQNAIKALNNAKMRVASLPKIELDGMDLFRQRVLYSVVKYDDALTQLRDCLIDSFTEQNINILDKFMFVPHVSVLRLSRPVTRERRRKFVEPYLYLDFENKCFGSQDVTTLCLCEMGKNRRDDGFYNCALEIDLM